MENSLEPTQASSKILMVVLFILSGVLIVSVSVFIGMQIEKSRPVRESTDTELLSPSSSSTQLTPSVTSANPTTNQSISTTTTLSTSENWKTAKFGGIFTYEYPTNWHVAELWNDNYSQNGILIAMDPNPINTAPRGGPLATFNITVLNGNKNPDEILAKRMSDFNADNYSDIVKETLTSSMGIIYHYTGKFTGEMMKGSPAENYFFTINKNPNDPSNQQVVIASLTFIDDPKLSEMLKHIVLNIKKITL